MPNTAMRKKPAMIRREAEEEEEGKKKKKKMGFGLFDDEPEGLSVFYCTFVVDHAMYDSELGSFML